MTRNNLQILMPQIDLGQTAPGREIRTEQLYRLPSGKVRRVSMVSRTFLDPQVGYRTVNTTDVDPPLDCTCIPQSPHQIAECTLCGSVVCSRHATTCRSCGRMYCTGCLQRVTIHDITAILCKPCVEEIKQPKWIRFLKDLFWGE